MIAIVFLLIPGNNAFAGIKVIASNLPVYIFALNIAGGRAEVGLLMKTGSETHDLSLSPGDMAELRKADLILLNGAGLDDFIIERLGPEKSKAVDTSDGIIKSQGPASAVNSHIWLDPAMASMQVENIAKALSSKDPANSAYYAERAEAYIKRLDILDRELAEALAPHKGGYLVTYHDAFYYLALRYGLRPLSLAGPHGGSASAGRLAEITRLVNEKKIQAFFIEDSEGASEMKSFGARNGIPVCPLYTVGAGNAEPGFYELAMRENLESLIKCLGGPSGRGN